MADSTTNLGFTLPRYKVTGPYEVTVGTEGSLTYPLTSSLYEYTPPWHAFAQSAAMQDLKRAMVPATVEGMTPYSAGNWMNVQPIAQYGQQFGILTPGQGTNLGFPGWYSNAADIPNAGSTSNPAATYANTVPFTPNLNNATTNVNLQSLWNDFQNSLGAPNQNSPLPLDLSKVPGIGATSTPTPVSGVSNLGLTTTPTIGTPPLPEYPTIGTPPLLEYPTVAGPAPVPAGQTSPVLTQASAIPGGYDPNTGAMDFGPGITGTPTGTAPQGLSAQVADWLKGLVPPEDLSARGANRWAHIADYPTDLGSIVKMLDANESYTPWAAAVNYNADQIRSLLQAGVPMSLGYSTWVVPDGQGGYRWVVGDLFNTGASGTNGLWASLSPDARMAMAQAINSIAPTSHTQFYVLPPDQVPVYNG